MESVKNKQYRSILNHVSGMLRTEDGTVEKVKSTTTALWENMFNPYASNTSKAKSREALGGIFDSFMQSDLNYLSHSWFFNLDFAMARKATKDSLYGSLERLASRIPAGNHIVIPVMTTGIVSGAVVNKYLGDRSSGYAFMGFSNNAYGRDNPAEGRVRISGIDSEFLRRNRFKSALVVTSHQESSNSMRYIIRKLKRLGFERERIAVLTED